MDYQTPWVLFCLYWQEPTHLECLLPYTKKSFSLFHSVLSSIQLRSKCHFTGFMWTVYINRKQSCCEWSETSGWTRECDHLPGRVGLGWQRRRWAKSPELSIASVQRSWGQHCVHVRFTNHVKVHCASFFFMTADRQILMQQNARGQSSQTERINPPIINHWWHIYAQHVSVGDFKARGCHGD